MDRTIAALKICADRIAKHQGPACARHRHPGGAAGRATPMCWSRRAREEAGLDLQVISAEEEADLAAEGCAPLIGRKYKGALVFDIGGGSTEIIWLQKSPSGPQAETGGLGAAGRGDPGGELRRRVHQPRRL